MSDGHSRRRTGDSRHVVMFGQPVAMVAEPLGVSGKVETVAQGVTDRRPHGDGG